MCLLVKAQEYCTTPRCLSNVTGLAFAGSSSGLTQTFSTPSTGATKAIRLPSGLNRTRAFSGLPKKALRGTKGTPLGPAARHSVSEQHNENKVARITVAK